MQELQTTQKQLETAIADYRQGLNAEIEQTRQIRFLAIAGAREQATSAIVVAQNHLTAIETQLETAIDQLNELLAEENQFRSQYLVIYPILVATALFALLILIGIFNQSTLLLLDCYERTQSEQIDEDENIPDLIPEEIGSSRELKLAYQTLLLAIALGLLSQHSQGNYQFNGRSIGKE
ncbi:MAG: hypothetical protein ACYTX0_43750 [Nostoc sp.]